MIKRQQAFAFIKSHNKATTLCPISGHALVFKSGIHFLKQRLGLEQDVPWNTMVSVEVKDSPNSSPKDLWPFVQILYISTGETLVHFEVGHSVWVVTDIQKHIASSSCPSRTQQSICVRQWQWTSGPGPTHTGSTRTMDPHKLDKVVVRTFTGVLGLVRKDFS